MEVAKIKIAPKFFKDIFHLFLPVKKEIIL